MIDFARCMFPTYFLRRSAAIAAIILVSSAGWAMAQQTGSVLTPNKRTNTPSMKVGLRAGVNRTGYANDRYLDNVPLDVGDVSGETDIYSSAGGFGYQVGADLEYPLNNAISLLFTAEYQHAAFGSSGSVQEPCVHRDGTSGTGTAIHDFKASLNYLQLAASAKLTFSTWYITTGLAAAHPLSTSLVRTRQLGGADCFYPGPAGKSLIEENGEVPSPKSIHYSVRLGVGMIYQLANRVQFAPEITLDYGFNAINKSPNSDIGVYGLSATIRYDLR